jgi:hypothetical protein
MYNLQTVNKDGIVISSEYYRSILEIEKKFNFTLVARYKQKNRTTISKAWETNRGKLIQKQHRWEAVNDEVMLLSKGTQKIENIGYVKIDGYSIKGIP